jgi:pyruvate formate lyase activating enzyme
MMKEIKGILLDTKRFAVHDGPGIRTAFFTKGCPLKCLWCHNPESTSKTPEMGFYAHLCHHCGKCAALCPAGAQLMGQGQHRFKKEICRTCGLCETECPGNAMKLYGKTVSVAEALALALEDRDFYEESGGGVTVSGGEPLIQKEFSFALFKALKAEGIHTALDTCAFVPQSVLAEMLSVTDLFLVDFKHADSFKHRQLTAVPTEMIKSNLKTLLLFRIFNCFNGVDYALLIIFLNHYATTVQNKLGATAAIICNHRRVAANTFHIYRWQGICVSYIDKHICHSIALCQ